MPADARRYGVPLAFLLLALDLWAQRDSVELTVRVSEAGSELPIEQVRVELVRFPDEVMSTRFTDSTGMITFPGLRTGAYLLRFRKMGYENAEARIELRRGEYSHSEEVRLTATRGSGPSPPGLAVTARELSIPAPAQQEFQKGLELLKGGKEGGIEHFQKAAILFPGYYEAHFGMGMAYVQLKAHSQALASLSKAIEINPKFLPPYYPLAVLLLSQKRHNEAEPLLLKALSLDEKNWQYPFELARSLGNQQKWGAAIKYAGMAMACPNPPAKIHLLLADLYSGAGKAAQAIQELETFRRKDPQSPYMPVVEKSLEKLRTHQ
jgi:tetratricopeptide (TPR) repeat protein